MKFGFVMATDKVQDVVAYAVEAEEAGWDAFLLSDVMWGMDVWLCLAAAAMRTETIRLGTLLTPLSIMRPWKLAAQAATLDQLSNGRALLTIGMGAPEVGFDDFGEETDLPTRAERVDEGLDIVTRLWQGEPFSHQGKHYRVDNSARKVKLPPVQKPRIPIWVVGAWPRPKSMQRVLRCDGVVPYAKPKAEEGRPVTPDEVRALKGWIEERRATPFDIVIEGQTPGDDPDATQAIIQSWEEAGATWWIESIWESPSKRDVRLRQGPHGAVSIGKGRTAR